MSLSVRDLMVRMQARQAKRHQCFDKVLEKCFAYIERIASKDQQFCLYEVPHFLMGYPIYDLNECIKYLIEKLQEKDFLVKYYFPQILYISWNVNEINEDKVTKGMSLIHALEGPGTSPPCKTKKRVNNIKHNATSSITQQHSTPATVQKAGFIKSVKQFKPSGKLVLDLI